MLRFEVHELHLESLGRYFLPLPKLSGEQLQFLARHLREREFSVRSGVRVHARRGSNRISIDPSGLARSSEGSLDAIAPAIPELLRFPKEKVSFNPYFDARRVRAGFAVRLATRMESSSLWTALRGSGQCALAPDEGLVLRELLSGAHGELECVTDYPTSGCRAFQIGRRAYYRSMVPAGEFAANLRTLSSARQRSCYLPKHATVIFRTDSEVPRGLPEELGEWCFLDL